MQLNTTETGLDVILSTADEELEVPPTSMRGNALIVDISNATLNLPDREEFQATDPVEGIAQISYQIRE